MQTAPNPFDWIGREMRSQDVIAPAILARMAATLDVPVPQATLPPLWHWIFHIDAQSASALGRDGHPALGGFLPPVPLPRRMWAGGALRFHSDIPVSARVEKVSTIADVTAKSGRSGPLYFVKVTHHLSVDGALAVEEDHDIVYRADPAPDAKPPAPLEAPQDAAQTRVVQADSTLLFRYSALTFNGHRIHYDADYARDVEGYPDIVVHGPLLATLLAGEAAALGAMRRFTYRARAPICGAGPITLSARSDGRGQALWAASPSSGLAMTAQADYAD